MRALAAAALFGWIFACGAEPAVAPAAPTFEAGATFPDLALEGYLDRDGDGALSPAEWSALGLSEVIARGPRPEVLLVHVAFGWCKYCWTETRAQVAWTERWGGRFRALQVVIEDRDGRPADRAFLDQWIATNRSALPTTIEPRGTLFARFGRSATYLLIDGESRKILEVGAGPPTFDRIHHLLEARLGP
jgi:hypothetical protein